MVEAASGKAVHSTNPRVQIPVFPPLRMLEEFLVGMAVDTNMAEMMTYFDQNQEEAVTGDCFWEKTGLKPEVELRKFF